MWKMKMFDLIPVVMRALEGLQRGLKNGRKAKDKPGSGDVAETVFTWNGWNAAASTRYEIKN